MSKENKHGIRDGIEEVLCAPSDEVLDAIKIRIRIEPSSGAVMIYGGPNYDKAELVEGPVQEVAIATTVRTVIVQLVRGAKSYEIETLGYLAKRP